MTGGENERLGVLETKVGRIESDVSEIKQDVKSLISDGTKLAIDLAAKGAAEAAVASARTQTGVWVRFFTERGLAILAVAIAVISILK